LWLSLGVSLMEQEKWEGATAAFCQSVSLEPKNPRARRLLALTLGRRGWLDGAEQEFRKAIELEPEDGGAHYNLALLYLDRKPPLVELGRRHYYRAVDLGVPPDPAVVAKLEGKPSRVAAPR
jgi:Tfp pilus assembly protein PilF